MAAGFHLIDELDDQWWRGSSSPAKKIDAAFNISFASRRSRFSLFSFLISSSSTVDYKTEDLGVKALDPRGFIQVSGRWYLDSMPTVLRNADNNINDARNKYGEDAGRLAKAEAHYRKVMERHHSLVSDPVPAIFHSADTIIAQARKEYGASAHALAQAETLYAQQLQRRTVYMLKYKGIISSDWTRRYLLPDATVPTTGTKQRPNPRDSKTVMMKRPTEKEAKDANAGGLKHEQYFPYGSDQWKAFYGMRNGVESLNRNIKRGQFENLADPDNRTVRGNTFTYLVAALATVSENLRQMLSFYKRKLALTTCTPKNQNLPSAYWQSDGPAPTDFDQQRQPD
ncbi:MAG: hypothetical protein ABI053_01490 [Lacisediminihabitans sp.]